MTLKIPIDWKSIIYRGIESDELDYKAAQNWRDLSRPGKAKFVRHCLAMANTKGGYIVVGVGEDEFGRPCDYTGLTERESRSFDPTDVGHFVNRYADPAIDLDVERPVVDGKQYVVFVIRRFSALPHVCGYPCELELQQGGFYIRTADASSRVAYRASEIHAIMQRALRNQREYLGRMLRGILYESGDALYAADAKSDFLDQIETSRSFISNRDSRFNYKSEPLLEITAELDEFDSEKFGLTDVHNAVNYSSCTLSDVPFLFTGALDEAFFTNLALRSCSRTNNYFWQAFQSGLFHYVRPLERPDEVIYQEVVKHVAEAVHFFCEYYPFLGMEEEIITLRFRLHNVDDYALKGLESYLRKKQSEEYICHISDVKVKIRRSTADLTAGSVQHSARIVREICERFNFPFNSHEFLEEIIAAFLGKRI